MHWGALVLSGLMEAFFPFLLTLTEGFTRWKPLVGLIIFGIGTLLLFRYALRIIPISIGYLVWTSIGVVGSVLIGVLVLNEPLAPIQIFFLITLIAGIVGLKTSLTPNTDTRL